MENSYHIPVFLDEVLEGLALKEDGRYLDLTFGGGGHSKEILKHLKGGTLWAFDQDPDTLKEAKKIEDPRFNFVQANFRALYQILFFHKVLPFDGVLLDLGVSSHQLNTEKRGFAARLSGPLDMRMDPSIEKKATDFLATYTKEELASIFWRYSDIKNGKKLAQTLVDYRKNHPLERTQDLCKAIAPCLPPKRPYQYTAKVFQALRILVNDELNALGDMLEVLPKIIKPGGRLVAISYHSGEDRLVKRFIAYGNRDGRVKKDFYGHLIRPFEPIGKKVARPREKEIEANNRARSARLRIATRLSQVT